MKVSLQSVLTLAAGFIFASGAVPARGQQPCSSGLIGAAQIMQHEDNVTLLSNKLLTAYDSGDKKQEEALVKQLEGYTSHREITFSDDEKNKMEELAQRPEVKLIVEAIYTERRAAETEQAHNANVADCFFYPNPMLQDYVNKLGQSLVPRASSQFYAFRIVNDPRPDGWAFSTGSVYVTTGLMSMLDNEAQLAYVLAHEIGHVERRHLYARSRGDVLERLLDVEKIKSARKKGLILGAIAAGVGGAIGGAKGGGGGALLGASLGFGVTTLVTNLVETLRQPKIENDWSTTQESDADEFAAHEILQHDFDVREAPKVFLTLENSIHRDDRVGMGFHYGQVNNLVERRQHIQALLAGALMADLERRSKTGLQATSPNFALLMSEVKRDNGELALEYDLFDEARQNLEDAIALRSGDPTAHLYLGRVYKLTARIPGDETKAMDHFMQAIRLDTGRSAYPEPHLERALSLMKQNDQTVLADAQKEIKTYIELYKLNNGGRIPENMLILYDYLSLTGDDSWSQPPVVNVVQTQQTASQLDVRKTDARTIDAKKPR
jgi:tetratricopeptide (TPR) repeat protein